MLEFIKKFCMSISSWVNKPDYRDELCRSFDPNSLKVREVHVSYRYLIEHIVSIPIVTTVLITERELAQNKDLRQTLLHEIARSSVFSADDYEIISIQIGERFKNEQKV